MVLRGSHALARNAEPPRRPRSRSIFMPVLSAMSSGYARRNEVDLIVISTHGRSGFSRLSLGSVTDSLIRHTTIPVLVVKPPTSYLNPQVSQVFRRIVVPLYGSTLAEEILPRVLALAELEEAEITLLNVLIPKSYAQQEIEDPTPPWRDKDISTPIISLPRGRQASPQRSA